MSLISATDVRVELGGKPILDRITLSVEAGEIVTIVGPNGSGKSTLLKCLLGALPLKSGRLARAPGLAIGYVPQKLHIDASLPLTVRRFLSLPKAVKTADAENALARTGAQALIKHQMKDLSGGQFQRVLLARALLCNPDILILDEPTQGLDQPGSADFYRLIEDLRADLGCAVLMVSHELHVVMAASDRVICLNGHVCCEGAPEHVASAPEYRALFGSGTQGALALYRHDHDHSHSHHAHGHIHGPDCDHDHPHEAAE